jgi:CheY-like chemotaxis protein
MTTVDLGAGQSMENKHVLIVDDEPKVGYFLGRSLELKHKNCEVSTARSGEEALKILERDHVDLLITDLRMPGVSGLELIRWVKASSPNTRTILITAYGSDQIKAEARRLEVYRYLTKPFNVKDFTDVVDGALQDLIVTAPGFMIMSDQAFEAITERLERLRYDTGASAVFLADMQGQLLAQTGPADNIDSAMLLALLAGGFATSAELARRFNRGKAANLNFQEGEVYDIYSSNVGDNLIIAMLFDRRTNTSRIGMVWLYTQRVIKELLSVLSSMGEDKPDRILEDDFGSSLMMELDTAFGDDFEALVESPEVSDADSSLTSGPHQAGAAPQSAVRRASSSTPRASGERASAADAPARADAPEAAEPESPSAAPAAPEGGADGKFFSLKEAIRRGILPSDFNMQEE